MSNTKSNNEKEEEVKLSELIAAENELRNLEELERARKGLPEEPIEFRKDPIGWILSYKERRKKVRVNKKTYLWLCLLGVFGVHRFYAKQYIVGTLYLLLCWTGLSIANTIIDLIVVIPMQADEDGCIEL